MTRLNEIIRQAVEREVGGFLAHDPHNPARFWSSTANGIADALTRATGGPDHIVRVNGGGWTVQHPLAERFEPEGDGRSLLDCRFTRLVAIAAGQGAFGNGTHRVWLDRGVLQWEEVDG